jgi:hypothetical protein
MPRVNLPADKASSVAADLARAAVFHNGPIMIVVARPIRLVTAAAAAKVGSGS